MKKVFFAIMSIAFLVTSCAKEQGLIQNETDIFGFASLEEAQKNLGVYADLFTPTHGSMYIRSTHFFGGTTEQAEIFGRYNDNSNEDASDGGIYQLEDIELAFDEKRLTYLPIEGELTNEEKASKINRLFGKENRLSLKKDGKPVLEFKQYLPEKIKVNVLDKTPNPNSNLNSIKRENFKISWNSDNKNSNGVIAYLWWNGDRTDLGTNEQGQGEIINRAVKLDDNGEAKVSASFFKGIPQNAIITIFFVRGNAQIKEFENKSYKFYSITQEKHNLILAN